MCINLIHQPEIERFRDLPPDAPVVEISNWLQELEDQQALRLVKEMLVKCRRIKE